MRYNTGKSPGSRLIDIYEPSLDSLIVEMSKVAFDGYEVVLQGGPGKYSIFATHLGLAIPVNIDRLDMARGIARYIGACLNKPSKISLERGASTFARVLYAATEDSANYSRHLREADYLILLDAAYDAALVRLIDTGDKT